MPPLACKHSTQKTEAGRSQIQGQLGQQSELEARKSNNIRPCLKKINKKTPLETWDSLCLQHCPNMVATSHMQTIIFKLELAKI
jgi:hypothetical protein